MKGHWLTVALAGLLVAGCDDGEDQDVDQPGTPAPAITVAAESASTADVAAYVASLEFDTSVAAGDAQFMVLGTVERPRLGPWLAIAPERRANHNSREELAAGRIIGRVQLRRMPSDTSRADVYLWTDRRGGSWRAMAFGGGGELLWGPVASQLHEHDSLMAPGARARIIMVQPWPEPHPYCVVCTERADWCGRDPDLWLDQRMQGYLRNRLGANISLPAMAP